SLEKKIVRVLVVQIGFSLSDFIHGDWLERDRLQIFPAEVDVRDDALPEDRFIELNIEWWQVENEVAEIEKDRTVTIDFDAVKQRHAMHDNDIGARIDFFVRPFLEPVRRN